MSKLGLTRGAQGIKVGSLWIRHMVTEVLNVKLPVVMLPPTQAEWYNQGSYDST